MLTTILELSDLAEVVIFGAGGLGREFHEYLLDTLEASAPATRLLGFVDGNSAIHGTHIHGLPVLGGIEWVRERPGMGVVIALGSPAAKRKVSLLLREVGAVFPTVIHPSATVGRWIRLGEGSFVSPGCRLMTDGYTEQFVTFNCQCTMGHDGSVGAFSSIFPGAHLSGNVAIGEGVEIGTGVVTIPGVAVGEWSVVGGGAVVNRDLPANVTAVGVPAKVIRERPAGWHLE